LEAQSCGSEASSIAQEHLCAWVRAGRAVRTERDRSLDGLFGVVSGRSLGGRWAGGGERDLVMCLAGIFSLWARWLGKRVV